MQKEEENKCCFCSFPCDPLSQSCGTCPREILLSETKRDERNERRDVDNNSVLFISIRSFYNKYTEQGFFIKKKEDVYINKNGDEFVLESIPDGEDDYRFEYFINGKQVKAEDMLEFHVKKPILH